MTQREKIELLKTTIVFLYEKEGRSKSYISKLLDVDRKTLTYIIEDWDLKQANLGYLNPSNQKFANKHRQFIKSKLDQNMSQIKIAKELGVSRDYLINIINKDDVLSRANKDYVNRLKLGAEICKKNQMENSSLNYNVVDEDGEEWTNILGYEHYFISNKGRIKKYIKRYDSYTLLKSNINSSSGRSYIKIEDKGLQVSRLVGFAFVEGYSDTNNTIDHIDGDFTNNIASNLQWVSQSENNKRAYTKGRSVSKAYNKNKKFKKIVVDKKYEFKTIISFANFCNVSQSQAHRYISGECKYKYEIEFIY
ncbi:MAG: NUMOD4 domain-containing protein [Clostridium sp.]